MRTMLPVVCASVLCVILGLGVWPFHAPKNDVSWLGDRNGMRFGKYSTAVSSDRLPVATEPGHAVTIEIWAEPRSRWDSGTLLTLYSREEAFQFSVRESQTDLAIHAGRPDDPHTVRTARLFLDDVFPRRGSVFVTFRSGPDGTAVYLNGRLAKSARRLSVFQKALRAQLIVGDAPGQTDSWSGQIFGLAVYNRALTDSEIQQEYADWTGHSQPRSPQASGAVYLFDEHSGKIIRNALGRNADLRIPGKYTVVDKLFLEPVWSEFSMTRSYWGAVLKNVIGFIPFGCCFYALFSTVLPGRRAVLVTVLAGTAVSLTIEVLQGYLPTRESGTSDLITNTLGTYIGVLGYRVAASFVPAIFPRVSS